ncbi:MAG: endonuclease/exonuclease/phosphatase family protein [Clostridia bacterium]|nr:endonuclease/exonuclease/phosphatase family protein [Clostridia bacterium]
MTNAVDAYEENDRDLFCNKADAEIVFADTYAVDTLTVGGVNITDYVIVYPKKVPNYENEYAERLAAKIEEISGYRIPVYKDSQEWSAAHELHIGLTSSDDAYAEMLALETDAYVIEKVENKVILAASTVSGYVAGSDVLLAMLSAENAVEKTIAIDFSEKITAIGNDLSVKVMSYNIYYSMLVEPRMSHVIEMIEKHDPDVLGVQEAMPEWKEYLAEHLGDVYGIVGEGRGGGNNDEHNLILYRKDQFDLVESGTWWLSATPEVPSKYSASSLNRIVTYAVLERKHDGKKFVHFNTHLEHTSAEARDLQVEVLLNIAGEYTEYPRFMTGDFNAKKNANVVQRILESGYSDSYDVAKNAVYDPTSPSSTVVIDYCFVSTDLIQVEKYRVDTFHYNIEEKDPSDHNPVIVDLIIK